MKEVRLPPYEEGSGIHTICNLICPQLAAHGITWIPYWLRFVAFHTSTARERVSDGCFRHELCAAKNVFPGRVLPFANKFRLCRRRLFAAGNMRFYTETRYTNL